MKRSNFVRHMRRMHEAVHKEKLKHTVNGIYRPRVNYDFENGYVEKGTMAGRRPLEGGKLNQSIIKLNSKE